MRMSERESMFEDATEELIKKIDDVVEFIEAEEPDMYDSFRITCEEWEKYLKRPILTNL